MYDIVFIDDKFDEIKETYLTTQKDGIRCYYSDGEDGLPKEEEKLKFQYIKAICLDFHLENIGINQITNNNNTAYSTLANIIKSFVGGERENYPEIFINTAFNDDFDEDKLKKYLKSKKISIKTIGKGGKDKKFSELHENEKYEEIKKQAQQSVLRSLVISEAINIENEIWDIIKKRFPDKEINEKIIKEFQQNIKFSNKIKLYKLLVKKDIQCLDKLRKKRNHFAHDNDQELPIDNSQKLTITSFLKEIEKIRKEIQ